MSISKLSLAPFSKITICPESLLCVDIKKTLVPKDTIKNCASTLLRFIERVESHLFDTWRPSYSKIYLARFSVVHQSNSFAMILCIWRNLCDFGAALERCFCYFGAVFVLFLCYIRKFK